MKRWQWYVVAGLSVVVALEAYVYAQPAPNNCGLNMLCRIRTLIVSRDATFTGDAGWTGNTTIGGTLTVTGKTTVSTINAGGVVLDGGARLLFNVGTTHIESDTLGGVSGAWGAGANFTGNFSTTGNLSADGTVRIGTSAFNSGSSAACTTTTVVCINDPQGFEWTNGSGTTVGAGTAAGLISGDTGVSSGAVAVTWGGVIPETTNGQGGYLPTTVGRGSKFRQVTCSCRVAGSGGTTGIVLSLMEDGVEVDTQEINAGADTNACDDAAGTLLSGDFDFTFTAAKAYTLQVKSSTDCAGNPTDCSCNIDVTR